MFYEKKIKYLDYIVDGVRDGNAGFWKVEANIWETEKNPAKNLQDFFSYVRGDVRLFLTSDL